MIQQKLGFTGTGTFYYLFEDTFSDIDSTTYYFNSEPTIIEVYLTNISIYQGHRYFRMLELNGKISTFWGAIKYQKEYHNVLHDPNIRYRILKKNGNSIFVTNSNNEILLFNIYPNRIEVFHNEIEGSFKMKTIYHGTP